MALTESIPGMEPGSTGRNAAVGAAYVITAPLWLIFLPLIAAIVVGLNYGGLAERLAAVPGIGPEGGAIAGVAAFAYVTVIFLILSAATPDSPSEEAPGDAESTDDVPTATPDGGETEAPSTAGDATDSPAPTDTQIATASPTPEPATTPSPQSFSGQGAQATDRFALDGGLVIFDLEHTGGDGNFAVWLKNSDGEREELLANDIGEWDGSVVMNAGQGEYFLDIEASGDWRITARQPRPTSGASLPQSMEETHSNYVGPVEYSGAVRVTFEGFDDDNYAVWQRDQNGQRQELLFNEIGPTGELSTVTSAQGIWFIAVETNGEWTIRVEEA